MTRPVPVRGVLFDLDDTIFDQSTWLDGAWDAVADAGKVLGLERDRFRRALGDVAALGSARGRIIDRALELIGAGGGDVLPLLRAFRAFEPRPLEPYAGARESIAALRQRVPVGLVTDGEPSGQQGKLAALGLMSSFDAVVFSDELGRQHRKPDPLPFRLAAERLGVPPAAVVVVGDRPSKDVAGAAAAGMRAVRVLTGEYASDADDPRALAVVSDLAAALALISTLV